MDRNIPGIRTSGRTEQHQQQTGKPAGNAGRHGVGLLDKPLPDSAEHDQKFMVIIIDTATMDGSRAKPPVSSEHIVTACSPEEAADKAVAKENEANDYAPEDDGGFIPVATYSTEDMWCLLTKMTA